MKNIKLILILLIIILSPPVFAEDVPGSPESEELQVPETEPVEVQENLPEGLRLDEGGNVEETGEGYTINLKLPQSLVGSRVSIQDPNGINLKELTVDETGEISYSSVTPQNLNIILQGEVESEEESDGSTISVASAVIIAFAVCFIVALLTFIAGRISALHVLKDLRDYIYDKNLD